MDASCCFRLFLPHSFKYLFRYIFRILVNAEFAGAGGHLVRRISDDPGVTGHLYGEDFEHWIMRTIDRTIRLAERYRLGFLKDGIGTRLSISP